MTKRLLPLSVDISIDDADAVFDVDQTHVGAWALEIALLLNGLTEEVTALAPSGASIVLTLQAEPEQSAKRTIASRIAPNQLRFALSRTQAEYLQSVLLRAYRDGMAEVSHIHIEGFTDTSEYDLTFAFREFHAPMSAEDAAKLLQD